MVDPGRYTITLVRVSGEESTPLAEPQVCEVIPLTAVLIAQP
jgi:hypothetical protein